MINKKIILSLFSLILFASLLNTVFALEEANNQTCEISATIKSGEENYIIGGKQFKISVHMWNNNYVTININNNLIYNHLTKGYSLKTEDLIISVIDYKYNFDKDNDYLKLCINDDSFSCPECHGVAKEAEGEVEGCFDSDLSQGYPESYYIKGYVDTDLLSYNLEDRCNEEQILAEAVCYDQDGEAIFKIYECPNGCKNGACVKGIIDNTPSTITTIPDTTSQITTTPLTTTIPTTITTKIPTTKPNGSSCEDNSDCKSNICIKNKCVSKNVFAKVFRWFKGLFG